jgi:peptidoglycan/xylan/chitin deacetylase (PgdA/CDA1 family)
VNRGNFVISLDFELMWGVRDKKTIDSYGTNIKNVHFVIPQLLSLFSKYKIKATFSTVGFLFFSTKEALLQNLPFCKPAYSDKNLSPYNGYINTIGENVSIDPYHFGNELILKVKQDGNHEIGTHTFSHYYCLEEGQTTEQFEADLIAAKNIALNYDVDLKSLVFPRNQFNENYLKVCASQGIICYRGNEKSWIYSARNGKDESKVRRAFRLLDTYLNLSGSNCYTNEELKKTNPINIPSSRFLRPFSSKLKLFESIRLRRITRGMTFAAKNNLVYHLWWHPHNFGANQRENFEFLEKIFLHFQKLNSKYNFSSNTMKDLALKLMKDNA